jgi:preprotein translocase subunit SecE
MKTTSAVLVVVAATLAVSAVHDQVLERPFRQIEKKVSRHL